MTIADDIRKETHNGKLHQLVATNLASPRGLCNSMHRTGGMVYACTLDYDGIHTQHQNDSHVWIAPWPPNPRINLMSKELSEFPH